MTTRRCIRPVALLLALCTHAVIAYLVFVISGDRTGQAAITVPAQVVSVHLAQPDFAQHGSPAEAVGLPETSRNGAESPAAPGSLQAKETPVVAIAQPVGPYYFRSNELTQRPVLLHDAVADLVLRVPGLPPQPVILRLLINDEGNVDRVVVENSFLAADVERYVTEAFAHVRFAPGKIGRIAVRSQLRVEARLESMEHRLPDMANS